MKVYVAELIWHYEGGEVIGIFEDEATAISVGESRRKVEGTNRLRGDELQITEWEVE